MADSLWTPSGAQVRNTGEGSRPRIAWRREFEGVGRGRDGVGSGRCVRHGPWVSTLRRGRSTRPLWRDRGWIVRLSPMPSSPPSSPTLGTSRPPSNRSTPRCSRASTTIPPDRWCFARRTGRSICATGERGGPGSRVLSGVPLVGPTVIGRAWDDHPVVQVSFDDARAYAAWPARSFRPRPSGSTLRGRTSGCRVFVGRRSALG